MSLKAERQTILMVKFTHDCTYVSGLQVELPGCKGIWTVYHKNSRGHNVDSSKVAAVDDEYHAYLIISMEARTMVISFTYFGRSCLQNL